MKFDMNNEFKLGPIPTIEFNKVFIDYLNRGLFVQDHDGTEKSLRNKEDANLVYFMHKLHKDNPDRGDIPHFNLRLFSPEDPKDNLKDFYERVSSLLNPSYDKYYNFIKNFFDRIGGIGNIETHVVVNSSLASQLLSSEFNDHYKETFEKTRRISHWQPNGLIVSDDDKRKSRRNINTQALFTKNFGEMPAAILGHFTNAITDALQPGKVGDILDWNKFTQLSKRISEQVITGTNDTIAESFDELWHQIRKSQEPTFLGIGGKRSSPIHKHLSKVDTARDSGGLLNILRSVDGDRAEKLEQIPQWMFAMKDALEITVPRTLVLILSNPSIVKTINAELTEKTSGDIRKLQQPDVINNLDFIENCIKETIRLWTPVPFIIRSIKIPIKLGELNIQKDNQLLIPANFIHRSESAYGSQPNRFNPSRWNNISDEKADQIFFGFSQGERSCPGRSLIMFMMKSFIAQCFQNYQMVLEEPMEPASRFIPATYNNERIKIDVKSKTTDSTHTTFDYIVIGSGAGGAPLAARLAENGKRVLVLEAGHEGPDKEDQDRYEIPALHAKSTETDSLSWKFYVKHFADDEKHNRSRVANEENFVLYPRSSVLGGCTTHYAMITTYPHDSDWASIQKLTQDNDWSPDNMRKIFKEIENCRYLDKKDQQNQEHHGFNGWLSTNIVSLDVVKQALTDRQLVTILRKSIKTLLRKKYRPIGWVDHEDRHLNIFERLESRVENLFDRFKNMTGNVHDFLINNPSRNDDSILSEFADELSLDAQKIAANWIDPNQINQAQGAEGIFAIPHATRESNLGSGPKIRQDARLRLLDTQRRHPNTLEIRTGCFVTRLLFASNIEAEAGFKQVTGVEYIMKSNIYRAEPENCLDPNELYPAGFEQHKEIVKLNEGGEVIVSGGTFNTPQILMLSGIGPTKFFNDVGRYIPVRQVNESVGRNLQDRYEVGVVWKMKKNFSLLENAGLNNDFLSPQSSQEYLNWTRGRGLYSINGGLLGLIMKSKPVREEENDDENGPSNPDIFMFCVPGQFKGYFDGWSENASKFHDRFTWVILKGHTRNQKGEVTLLSDNPLESPEINFHYFADAGQDGNQGTEEDQKNARHDREALKDAISLVREIGDTLKDEIDHELVPGKMDLDEFVELKSWGHHACGTCAIGEVVDSKFKVKGINNLRVVDASVFPEIPGFFIVLPTFMISEKAANDILKE